MVHDEETQTAYVKRQRKDTQLKVTYTGKVVESQEEGHLFARLMVVSKSRPGADLKAAIGQYEFSMVPRSLFAPDGTMLHCSTRSSLMIVLEKLSGESQQRTNAAPWTSVDDRMDVDAERSSQLRHQRLFLHRYDLPSPVKTATLDLS